MSSQVVSERSSSSSSSLTPSTSLDSIFDEDGLRVITRDAIISELWCSHDYALTIRELTILFELHKSKNANERRYAFRQIIADLTYIRNDPVKGFTLLLKKCYYPNKSQGFGLVEC